jgi:hypothetical protein
MQVIDSGCTEMSRRPFYDAQGRKHDHDENTDSTTYQCGECRKTTRVQHHHRCTCGWTQADPHNTGYQGPRFNSKGKALIHRITRVMSA